MDIKEFILSIIGSEWTKTHSRIKLSSSTYRSPLLAHRPLQLLLPGILRRSSLHSTHTHTQWSVDAHRPQYVCQDAVSTQELDYPNGYHIVHPRWITNLYSVFVLDEIWQTKLNFKIPGDKPAKTGGVSELSLTLYLNPRCNCCHTLYINKAWSTTFPCIRLIQIQ